jgi:hypothetical protein
MRELEVFVGAEAKSSLRIDARQRITGAKGVRRNERQGKASVRPF